MTAAPSIDPAQFLHDHLAQASPDLMRELLTTFVNALLSANADAVCGAAYNACTPERVNSRNGYGHRDLDTRVGTIDVATPKLRAGSYFPEWLLERRRRAEVSETQCGEKHAVAPTSGTPRMSEHQPGTRAPACSPSRRC